MKKTPDEISAARYERQIILPEFGLAGQARLHAARVLIVGVGGLGSPAALYLAAAGVGTLGLVDFDSVDETNLHRQIIYGSSDVGQRKIASAMRRLADINPLVRLEPHDEPFGERNASRLVGEYDIVVDGTDNFSTRYLVNDACVMSDTWNVYGSVSRFEGQVSVFGRRPGPCYRCLHPEPPPPGLIPSCAEGGVLGVLPGVIGTLQATEVIKLLTGVGEPLAGRLLLYDALRMRMREIALSRDPGCPVCGDHPVIRELKAYEAVCEPPGGGQLTIDELKQWRAEKRSHMLIDVREPSEHAASNIDGAVLIPIGTLPEQLDLLPKDQPIVVHCQSGGRSSRATAMLRAKGYDAHNLQGGIQAWKRTP